MKQAIWDGFCSRFNVYEHCVPLFELDGDGNAAVKTKYSTSKTTGLPRKKRYLVRSDRCEELILSVTDQLVADWVSGAKRLDGMLYMMGWKQSGKFVPLYIGKTESKGRNGGMSANITNLRTSKGKFARWGDGYQYHIGDLSACLLPGHEADTRRAQKYLAWAEILFLGGTTKLREPVYFWATEWDGSQVGIFEELGPTSLSSLEYLLIGLAGDISPRLLNREGVSRSLKGSIRQ